MPGRECSDAFPARCIFIKMKPPYEFKALCVRECVSAVQTVQTPGVQESNSPRPIEQRQPARSLKIETEGDFWKGLTKPKIRLMGRWLERAGFKPGQRVHVACLSPGVIELRSPADWPTATQVETP